MTWAFVTLLSPSVKATAPAALSRPISVISWPSRPLVSAAIGCTCTIAVSRARRSTKSTVAGSSITGAEVPGAGQAEVHHAGVDLLALDDPGGLTQLGRAPDRVVARHPEQQGESLGEHAVRIGDDDPHRTRFPSS